MPLPIAPVAAIALRYGAVALVGALVARQGFVKREQKDSTREAAYDGVRDGTDFIRTDHDDESQFEASHGHWRRVWMGDHGVEIDTRLLGRLRLRRLRK